MEESSGLRNGGEKVRRRLAESGADAESGREAKGSGAG